MGILDILEPIYKAIPEIKAPEIKPTLKKRLMWTGLILLLFFLMRNINVIGLAAGGDGANLLGDYQLILGSQIGSLITVGIGPIVLASIILQLLVGGGILNINLSEPREKARFMAMQKLFAVLLCFFESIVYVLIGLLAPAASPPLIPGVEMLSFITPLFVIIIAQVALGAIILMYLDEIVSKYGVGSGIGLFIAGGVSFELFWRAFSPFSAQTHQLDLVNASGYVFRFFMEAGTNMYASLNAYMLPILFTFVVFLVVVFAEGIHVNIPITMGHKGTGGRYPVKFLYVSNIPVIFTVALFANFRAISLLVQDIPVVGLILGRVGSIMSPPYNLRYDLLAQLPHTSPVTMLLDSLQGFVLFFNPFELVSPFGISGETIGFAFVHALFYLIILTITCVIFGKFWVEMGNQGPEAIAGQLQKAGMSIPGFRRDPRVMTKVLQRYIPYVTILGSAFVGILAGFADLTGALGSGMGILLTVGIIYRLYEELAKLQLTEMHPILGKILG